MTKPKALTRAELRNFPLPAVTDGGKDDHGQLVVVAGCRQMSGTPILSAIAALRSGAGKVRVGTVASIVPALAVAMPEVLVMPLAEGRDGGFAAAASGQVEKATAFADAVVAGPGVRQGKANRGIARKLLQTGRPIALDAAMLHCLSPLSSECRKAEVTPVLLPHSGELAALLETDEEKVEADRLGAARNAAEHYRAIVLAKGAQSHVAAPDGRCWTYKGGVPGLGVAGSGDTLAGIVGGFLARGAEPLTALLWAVLIHGEAGEALARKIGPVGFLAREIADEIPGLLAS